MLGNGWMNSSIGSGGLSNQALYQRILSAASRCRPRSRVSSWPPAGPGAGCAVHHHRAVASTTDWNQTAYGLPSPFDRGEAGNVLPIALHYLTPSWVSVVGIGGLAAAVMSSMDSVLLSSASMFARNIYKNSLRVEASDRTCLGDPDLRHHLPPAYCVLHCPRANGYGALTGLALSTVLRGLSGEPLLHLPPVLLFPGWRRDPLSGAVSQYFPFRTAIMLLAMLSIPAVSLLALGAFRLRLLPASWDVMGVLQGGGAEEGEEGEEREARAVPPAKENLLALSAPPAPALAESC
ncbi:unnamed protein product [Boreogadus saida]